MGMSDDMVYITNLLNMRALATLNDFFPLQGRGCYDTRELHIQVDDGRKVVFGEQSHFSFPMHSLGNGPLFV